MFCMLIGVWVELFVRMKEGWLFEDVCLDGDLKMGVLVLFMGWEKLKEGWGRVDDFEFMEGDC